MITAERLREIISLTTEDIKRVLRQSGYSGNDIQSSQFVGVSTGAEFCYSITFLDTHTGETARGKVWVSRDGAGNLTADY